MGYIRHNAIIATGWQHEAVSALAAYAKEIGCEALKGDEMTNGYCTVCITPDGSKEGWAASNEGDARRTKIKEWIEAHSDWYFEWCEVAYGSDDCGASITDSAWRIAELAEQPNARGKRPTARVAGRRSA